MAEGMDEEFRIAPRVRVTAKPHEYSRMGWTLHAKHHDHSFLWKCASHLGQLPAKELQGLQ